jgi:hypothetical protein
MEKEIKRLFIGIEIQSPWPACLPKGRLLDVTAPSPKGEGF